MQWWSRPPRPPACTSLHSCTGMWSNKIPQPSTARPPTHTHHSLSATTTIMTTAATSPALLPSFATEGPLSPIKENGEGKKLLRWGGGGGGGWSVTLQTEHKERIHARSHTLPEKKEGHTFKCRAAALIYWVKMGRRRRVAEVRQGIFFFF